MDWKFVYFLGLVEENICRAIIILWYKKEKRKKEKWGYVEAGWVTIGEWGMRCSG